MNILWIKDGKKGHEKQVKALLDELSKTININIYEEKYHASSLKRFFDILHHATSYVFKKYDSNDIITLDGLRVKNNHGWWLIRASNTEEALVIRFEGKSEKDKKELSMEVKNLLKNEGLTLDNI